MKPCIHFVDHAGLYMWPAHEVVHCLTRTDAECRTFNGTGQIRDIGTADIRMSHLLMRTIREIQYTGQVQTCLQSENGSQSANVDWLCTVD